jgi:hypothetical protein
VDEGLFQKMGLEQLKNNVWLVNEKGERRDLVQFNPPKTAADMAVFYFARAMTKADIFRHRKANTLNSYLIIVF